MLDSLDTLIAFVLIMLVVSLLITILVQMFGALLNLRGWNLLMGLKKTFAVIVPDTGKIGFSRYSLINRQDYEGRKELAKYVLKGGLISDSFLPWIFTIWRHASAVRPDEIFDAIHRIAIGREPATEGLKANARKILLGLGVTEATIDDAAAQINSATATTKKLTDAVTEVSGGLPDDAKAKLQAARDDLASQLKAAGDAVASQVIGVAGEIDSAYQRFHYWSCIAQERAQQWLTMHTRILTVLFAVVAAFALQLDAVEIFKLVSSNKTVRDKLVAQAATVEAQAARILVDTNVLRKALKDWADRQTDAAIKDPLLTITVADIDTREDVQKKVADALNTEALKNKKPIGSFNAAVTAATKKQVEDDSAELRTLKNDLDSAGFALIAKDGLGRRWTEGWTYPHVLGVLFSVALLSLGAPFWYTTLKNLVDLRSQVAQNISKEQEQAGKKETPPKPEPPPTVK